MEFKPAVKHVLNNYATFNGRAVRSEYWYWTLFTVIVAFILGIVGSIIGTAVLGQIFNLLVLAPGLAVGARRLHDINRSGWWQLLLITVIGAFVLIYWYCQKGDEGTNRFGPPAPTA